MSTSNLPHLPPEIHEHIVDASFEASIEYSDRLRNPSLSTLALVSRSFRRHTNKNRFSNVVLHQSEEQASHIDGFLELVLSDVWTPDSGVARWVNRLSISIELVQHPLEWNETMASILKTLFRRSDPLPAPNDGYRLTLSTHHRPNFHYNSPQVPCLNFQELNGSNIFLALQELLEHPRLIEIHLVRIANLPPHIMHRAPLQNVSLDHAYLLRSGQFMYPMAHLNTLKLSNGSTISDLTPFFPNLKMFPALRIFTCDNIQLRTVAILLRHMPMLEQLTLGLSNQMRPPGPNIFDYDLVPHLKSIEIVFTLVIERVQPVDEQTITQTILHMIHSNPPRIEFLGICIQCRPSHGQFTHLGSAIDDIFSHVDCSALDRDLANDCATFIGHILFVFVVEISAEYESTDIYDLTREQELRFRRAFVDLYFSHRGELNHRIRERGNQGTLERPNYVYLVDFAAGFAMNRT